MFKQLRSLPELPRRLINRLSNFQEQLDVIRCRIDVDPILADSFGKDRNSEAYQGVFSEREPLVSVCIGTYNRARLLTERTLPSILSQDYKRLEVIIVGDACTDDTESRIRAIGDPRIRFVNLPERGAYPEDRMLRWMVAGTFPFNRALELTSGSIITHLDDDDEYVTGRISKLLEFFQRTRADLVWHPFWFEITPGAWKLNRASTFKSTRVTTSSVFYHRWFARVPWDPQAYRFREPGDWNRFRKFKYLGATSARYPEPLLRHFREGSQTTQA